MNMPQNRFQNVTEKPDIRVCQQLCATSPNSPILSAATNGTATRQAAVLFACMMRRTSVFMRVC